MKLYMRKDLSGCVWLTFSFCEAMITLLANEFWNLYLRNGVASLLHNILCRFFTFRY